MLNVLLDLVALRLNADLLLSYAGVGFDRMQGEHAEALAKLRQEIGMPCADRRKRQVAYVQSRAPTEKVEQLRAQAFAETGFDCV